jgi:hypothetical protein
MNELLNEAGATLNSIASGSAIQRRHFAIQTRNQNGAQRRHFTPPSGCTLFDTLRRADIERQMPVLRAHPCHGLVVLEPISRSIEFSSNSAMAYWRHDMALIAAVSSS